MSRIDEITRSYLRFLYASSQFRPKVESFLRGADATVDGLAATAEELTLVLTRLRGHNLVATSSTVVHGLPERVGLTGTGLICAGEYDGDLRAWQEGVSSRGTVLDTVFRPRSPGPHAAGRPTTVLVSAHRPEPLRLPPTAGLVRVARVLLLTLPSVQRDQKQCDTLRKVAEPLLATVGADGQPEDIRALARSLRTELTNGPVAETLGVVLLDGLDEAITEWEGPGPLIARFPTAKKPSHGPLRALDRTADSRGGDPPD